MRERLIGLKMESRSEANPGQITKRTEVIRKVDKVIRSELVRFWLCVYRIDFDIG